MKVLRTTLILLFITTGILHFIHTERFVQIVPPQIPMPREIVYITGIYEITGAIGLVFASTRKVSVIALIFLLILVFPANIYMAVENIQLGGILNNQLLQWIRLPIQGFLIWGVCKLYRN